MHLTNFETRLLTWNGTKKTDLKVSLVKNQVPIDLKLEGSGGLFRFRIQWTLQLVGARRNLDTGA